MKKWMTLLTLCLVTWNTCLLARSPAEQEGDDYYPGTCCPSPWFTGPLLAPSGHVITGGHINVEPYIFVKRNNGIYNDRWKSHSNHPVPTFSSLQIPTHIGLSQKFDVLINPILEYNTMNGVHSWGFGDLTLAFDYQLFYTDHCVGEECNWYPDVLITLGEVFPTGKYQKLNPNKDGLDASGGGSWQTYFSIVFQKLTFIYDCHFLRTRVNFNYNYAAPVHVKGFNAYGGGDGTSGKVYPGHTGSAILGFEYTLTRSWVLALDAMALIQSKTRFSGTSPSGLTGAPPSTQFSLAPAIEYNFNNNLGIIGGVWFTVAGRNSTQFANYTLAFNLYY